jgi:23S rRNA (cytidine1920-2'-O)/16S rRNA (cytidine1409-2'-O)-methyltransferase
VASKRRSNQIRIDQLLVEQGFCESRTKAQALILAGEVYINTQRIDKPSTFVAPDCEPEVRRPQRFVSRGGDKLDGALTDLALDVAGLVCVDVGASTGGFTDCLLQRGASRVYAVDVGHGLLAYKLQSDPRVVVRDRTNARFLKPEDFEEPIDFVVVDASFIGMTQLADALTAIARPGGQVLTMIKPQFEVGREAARANRGVIKDPELRADAIKNASQELERAGLTPLRGSDSKTPGPKGNVEHFLLSTKLASDRAT